MTIRHLKLFVEVYKTRNITKAAANMNMTQPTVTRAIQELEEHYNVKLFDRINNRIQPTSEGDRFYAYSSKTLDSYQYMETGMMNADGREIITIGATNSIGSTILPRAIRMYRDKYPEIVIKSIINNGENIHKQLIDNQIDFALMEGHVPGNHILYEVISQDKLVLMLPPDDMRCKRKSIALEELKNDAFLLREKGSIGRDYVDVLFSSHGFPIEPVMESASTHAIVQAVHMGLGVAILPEELVRHSITSGFVGSCEIKGIRLVKQNYIVWHEGKYLTARAKELMETCKSIALE